LAAPGGPGQRHSGAFGERGQQHAAGGFTRRTEQTCHCHQHAQHPELQDAGELQQRDRRNGGPQARSEATLTRRRPSQSMTGPVTSAVSTAGSSVQNATTPALAALPVLCSTNHGTPM